jgi:hypothetical protein
MAPKPFLPAVTAGAPVAPASITKNAALLRRRLSVSARSGRAEGSRLLLASQTEGLLMLADELIDLDQPRVDIPDPPESSLPFASPPRALQLQGRELELAHVPLIGMSAGPEDERERSDFLETSCPDAHD